jgi:hypothetical protein
VRRNGRAVLEAPRLYRALLRAGLAGLRATGHGGDRVLFGEVAPVTGPVLPEARRPSPTVAFLSTLLCLPGAQRDAGCAAFRRLAVRGFGYHPYVRGGSGSPLRRPVDALAIGNLRPLERLLDRAAARGRIPRRLPLVLTEYGFQTNPPDPLFGVPLARQAAYLDVSEWIAARDPRIRGLAQYLLRDDVPTGSFQSGLRFADGRPKPSLGSYGLPIWVTRTAASTHVFGRVRAARGEPATVVLEHRRTGATSWRMARSATVREPDGLLRWRVPSAGGWWRLRWERPATADVVSRVARAGG